MAMLSSAPNGTRVWGDGESHRYDGDVQGTQLPIGSLGSIGGGNSHVFSL